MKGSRVQISVSALEIKRLQLMQPLFSCRSAREKRAGRPCELFPPQDTEIAVLSTPYRAPCGLSRSKARPTTHRKIISALSPTARNSRQHSRFSTGPSSSAKPFPRQNHSLRFAVGPSFARFFLPPNPISYAARTKKTPEILRGGEVRNFASGFRSVRSREKRPSNPKFQTP